MAYIIYYAKVAWAVIVVLATETPKKWLALVVGGLFVLVFVSIKLLGGSEQPAPVVLQNPVQDKPTRVDRTRNIPPANILYLSKNTIGYKHLDKASTTRTIPAVWHGGKSYLPIIGERDLNGKKWTKVLIQDRPNGSALWVPFNDSSMKIYRGSDVIDIDSKTGILRRFNNRRLLLKTKAVLGKPSTPTPKGKFFITHLAATPNPSYGEFMLVTSAHSTAFDDFGGIGDAIVAIHGPIDSSEKQIASGARLSNGCVRLKLRYLDSLRDVKPGSLLIIH